VDALPCLGIGQESQVKDIQISQNINAASKHNIVARHGSITNTSFSHLIAFQLANQYNAQGSSLYIWAGVAF
jgi:hypothetical protein